jgi:hypothetical protein
MLLWRLSGRPHAEAFDGGYVEAVEIADLPDDWRRQEGLTQQRGDDWHKSRISPLLKVPSVTLRFILRRVVGEGLQLDQGGVDVNQGHGGIGLLDVVDHFADVAGNEVGGVVDLQRDAGEVLDVACHH